MKTKAGKRIYDGLCLTFWELLALCAAEPGGSPAPSTLHYPVPDVPYPLVTGKETFMQCTALSTTIPRPKGLCRILPQLQVISLNFAAVVHSADQIWTDR